MSRLLLPVCLSCLLSATALAQSSSNQAFSLSGRAGLASGLVYRGISLGDGHLTPELDLALDHSSGLYLHGWLTRVDLPEPLYYASGQRMWQTLVDVGYRWQAAHNWAFALAYKRYLYSDDTWAGSPNYYEIACSVEYSNYLLVDYAHVEDLWGLQVQQDVLSVGLRWPFTRHLFGDVTMGWSDQDGYDADRYSYLRFNVGYLLDDWSFQLQYNDTFGSGDLYSNGASGSQWVAQVNWYWE